MSFSAYLRLEDDDTDWFDGIVDFPVMPAVGTIVRVIDRNANLREWSVRKVIIEGRRQSSESPFKPALRIMLICSGD
ncbi:hypothetical protein [Sphingobium abikonense]|uniref:hypothetical protein n=1 Tax=Sphingobium abikonense TaxID=86193 RepID=UPI000787E418|nr:hypothetical protein [Sphingobium abikonense]